MVAGPNVVTPIAGPWRASRPAEPDTVMPPVVPDPITTPIALPSPAPTEPPGPSMLGPLLRTLGPALGLAVLVGLVAGRETALLLGAVIGVTGAAVGLWKAFRAT